MSENVKIEYTKLYFSVVMHGCKTLPLLLREEQGAEENIWTEEK
jgi:hypothetical protein